MNDEERLSASAHEALERLKKNFDALLNVTEDKKAGFFYLGGMIRKKKKNDGIYL